MQGEAAGFKFILGACRQLIKKNALYADWELASGTWAVC